MEDSCERNIPSGSVFIHENDVSKCVYVIKAGKARVYKKYQDAKITLAILGAGDICGEVALFDSKPRSASVEALTDLTVVVIGVGESQLAKLPSWAQLMMKTLANRLREADRQILSMKSIAEYEKKVHRVDHFTRTLYSECRRFLRILKLLYEEAERRAEAMSPADLRAELLRSLGPQLVAADTIWDFLIEEGVMRYQERDRKQLPPVALDMVRYERLGCAVEIEIASGRFLSLRDPARAIVERVLRLSLPDSEDSHEVTREQIVGASHGAQMSRALYVEGITELREGALIMPQPDYEVFLCSIPDLQKLYPIQRLLRRLDQVQVRDEDLAPAA